MVTITLPAVNIEMLKTQTPFGALVVPGHCIPEKRVDVNPAQISELISAAREAAANAYAPYSHFRVGAAVLMDDDPTATIYRGVNVENSSYGATVCAERTGLLHSNALGFRRLRYLAVSTFDALHSPLAERSPCGICRQTIKEFIGHSIDADEALIFIDNGAEDTLCEVFDIERLLPYGFNFAGARV